MSFMYPTQLSLPLYLINKPFSLLILLHKIKNPKLLPPFYHYYTEN